MQFASCARVTGRSVACARETGSAGFTGMTRLAAWRCGWRRAEGRVPSEWRVAVQVRSGGYGKGAGAASLRWRRLHGPAADRHGWTWWLGVAGPRRDPFPQFPSTSFDRCGPVSSSRHPDRSPQAETVTAPLRRWCAFAPPPPGDPDIENPPGQLRRSAKPAVLLPRQRAGGLWRLRNGRGDHRGARSGAAAGTAQVPETGTDAGIHGLLRPMSPDQAQRVAIVPAVLRLPRWSRRPCRGQCILDAQGRGPRSAVESVIRRSARRPAGTARSASRAGCRRPLPSSAAARTVRTA